MPFSAYSELPALSASVSDAEECPGLSRVPAVATAVTSFFLSVAFLPDEGQPGSLEEANCFPNGKSCPPGEGVSRGNACPLNSASGGQESGSVLSGASVSALW